VVPIWGQMGRAVKGPTARQGISHPGEGRPRGRKAASVILCILGTRGWDQGGPFPLSTGGEIEQQQEELRLGALH